MSENVIVSAPIAMSECDCPTRVGEVIGSISEMASIPNPYMGMRVYVRDEEKSYIIRSLKSKEIGGVLVPNAQVDEYSLMDDGKPVAWSDGFDLNNYWEAGIYNITGIRRGNNDNMPITNVGENASISARLIVTVTPEGDTTYRHIIGQTLILSNAQGFETKVYTRSAFRSSYDGEIYQIEEWTAWKELQSNQNVGELTSLDDLNNFTDNGIYSGVINLGALTETFVMIVINDYASGVSPRRVSQFKYSLTKLSGFVRYESRSGYGDDAITWGDWEITNKDAIDRMIADAVDTAISKILDDAPETFDTLKEIAAWIDTHGAQASEMLVQIQKNTSSIDSINDSISGISDALSNESTARQNADTELTNNQVRLWSVWAHADGVDLLGKNNNGANVHSIDIPSATTENAGVMSAEDKLIIEDIKPNINSVDGDNIEELELIDQNEKTLIRVNSNGMLIDEDEVLLNREGIFPEKTEGEESVLLETESGKPIVRLTGTSIEVPKVINKSYNCSILSSCYINKTGSIISNSTMNVYILNTSGLSVVNIDLLAPSTNGLPAYVGKNNEQVVTYKNHTEIDRQIYTVDVASFDTLYINVSKSGGTKVFVSKEELLNYESPVSGKVGLFLGDSLMQGVGAMVGYDAVSYVGKQLGCTYYNGGVGGTTMYNDNRGVNLYKIITALTTGDWSEADSFIESLMANNTGALWQELGSRFEDIKTLQARDISFIFINYGANDWKSGATLDNEDNKEDVSTVCGSLRYAIRTILEWCPSIQIFVSTPGYRTDEITTPEINGVSMRAFCDKIQQTCEELHIPCWNQYKSNGVNQYNADLYLSDGTHRSATGYALLGQQYTNFINNHLNSIIL